MKNEDFKDFYKKYYRFSVETALQVVKNRHTAEDIVQDMFEKLYQIRDNLDVSQEYRIRALVKRAALNKSYDYVKSAYARREMAASDTLEAHAGADSFNNGEAVLLRMEANQYKRLVLQKLRKENRESYEIMIKVKYLEMNPDEVAKEYGISRNTLNNRIHRTKCWIEKEILKMYGDK